MWACALGLKIFEYLHQELSLNLSDPVVIVLEMIENIFEIGQAGADIVYFCLDPIILALFWRILCCCCSKKQRRYPEELSDSLLNEELIESNKDIDCQKIKEEEGLILIDVKFRDVYSSFRKSDFGSTTLDVDELIRRDVITLMYLGMKVCIERSRMYFMDAISQITHGMEKKEFKTSIKRNKGKEGLINQMMSVSKFSFVEYAPALFFAFRTFLDEELLFEKSLDISNIHERFVRNNFSEGKSGSFICFTWDNKFLIKTIARKERKSIQSLLYQYYHYYQSNPGSLLVKLLGLYRINTKQGVKFDFVVMQNVLPSKCYERYDIKGSWINRRNHHDSNLGFDLDFLDKQQMIYVSEEDRHAIYNQLRNDTNFLLERSCMDYSLLIGMAKKSEQNDPKLSDLENVHNAYQDTRDPDQYYILGLIDFNTKFDRFKKAEKFFKTKVLKKDKDGISCQPSKFYRSRFLKRIKQILYTPPPSI